jgi:hypothetical protein
MSKLKILKQFMHVLITLLLTRANFEGKVQPYMARKRENENCISLNNTNH